MIPWREARFFVFYTLCIGALLLVIAGVRYYRGVSNGFSWVTKTYEDVVQTITGATPTPSPIPVDQLGRSAPRPDVNPVLTIPENPPSIFANNNNEEHYVGYEPNSEGEDYTF